MTRWTWAVVLLAFAVLAAAGLTLGNRENIASTFTASNVRVPLLGVSVASEALLAQDNAEFGRLPILRVYYKGLPPADAWTTGMAGTNKSAVIVSFKALPDTILSGADDAALSHFFDTAPTGHPIYYSYYHEPEDNIAKGQFSLTAYKAAWARVVALADAAHNPYLHSTLILMAYDLKPGAHRDWKNYLPSGHIISVIGWDAYPVGTGGGRFAPQLTPPAQFMGPAIAASKSAGLPYGFAEFGLSVPTGRPAWLTEVGNYLLHSGALFGTLFNSTIVTNGRTMDLTGDPASITVWRHFVTLSKDSSNQPAAEPSPSATGTQASSPLANQISGLELNPAALSAGGASHTKITFTLSEPADITVLILSGNATVVRQLSMPNRAAGKVAIPYYGRDGHGKHVPRGRYTVLIVASNHLGSATSETTLIMG